MEWGMGNSECGMEDRIEPPDVGCYEVRFPTTEQERPEVAEARASFPSFPYVASISGFSARPSLSCGTEMLDFAYE